MSNKLAALVASIVMAAAFNFGKVHAANVVNRYNGVDRYETAAKVCEDGWQGSSDYAVIVNGENYPDALSAAPLAKKYEAPILLTGKDILNPYTSVQINRLNVKNVFLIGGQGVISQSIEDALKARRIKVTRIGGADRYETDILVAQKLGKPTEIAVINGEDFHDGMSIAPIAALKGMPIILTGKDYIPNTVKKYLQANKKIAQAYVIGGTDQISDDVISYIPSAKRIADGDVYKRNADIINAFQNEISTGTLFLASAKDFPDSLVAASVAPKTSSPILYIDSPISDATTNFLRSKIVNNIKILGGTGVVDYYTQQIAEALPLNIAYVDNFTDSIWQGQKYTPRPTIIVTASDGTIKEVPVTWNVSKVNITKPGIYTINGKVDGTYRTVYTTLVVKPLPTNVADISNQVNVGDTYSLPTTVNAKMSDGTVSTVPITWDYGEGARQTSTPGIYTFYGTVDKYNKKVKLILTVKDNGSGSGSGSGNANSPFDNSSIEIVQGEAYKLPKTVLDKISNKNVPVTWNTTSINTSKTGIINIEGTVAGSAYKAYLTLIVTPKIVDVPQIVQTVVQGTYYSLPTQVDAKTSDGTTISVSVTWDTPFVDLGTPQTYYIKGTVNHYKNPVVLVLKVVSY
ncbi:cell wall-binding repeat-containing protein [Clostridium sp. DJ247]|nr:cell wall-binding repeat-containing protein [Clostridium sp. DJ247]